ncbi:MAG: flagellar protein FlgN [Treponema sp.]|jgi:hypothetical protein|nr:flagellar protein FlgN [Treponema sp.]
MDALVQQSMTLMHTQTALLDKLTSAQDAMREAVMNREWDEFETLVNTMDTYSDQFNTLETERATLFATLTGKQADDADAADTTFYAFASHLPHDERRELTGLYRELKLRALRLRAANDSLMLYLNEAKGTVDGFINAAFPERKTNLYSRFGTKIGADMRCLVLNRIF